MEVFIAKQEEEMPVGKKLRTSNQTSPLDVRIVAPASARTSPRGKDRRGDQVYLIAVDGLDSCLRGKVRWGFQVKQGRVW